MEIDVDTNDSKDSDTGYNTSTPKIRRHCYKSMDDSSDASGDNLFQSIEVIIKECEISIETDATDEAESRSNRGDLSSLSGQKAGEGPNETNNMKHKNSNASEGLPS